MLFLSASIILTNVLYINLAFNFRFGLLKNGTKDIKNHEWFKTLDWDAVLNKKVKPAYKPKVSGEGDTSNFDQYDEEPFRTNSINEYAEEFTTFNIK